MTDSPLVSVVVPTFRRPLLLRTCLSSVLAQTHANIEVLVCDDGDDVDTKAVVDDLDDPRVTYTPRRPHLGMYGNVVSGLRATSGEYLIKIDDDDFWHPDLLSTLVMHLTADPTASVAFSDHLVVDADGEVQTEATERNSERWGRAGLRRGRHQPFYALAVQGTLPMQFTALMRRDAIDLDDFPEGTQQVYDLWLAYLACRDGLAAHYEPRRLGYYRVHGGSETATGRARMESATLFCYAVFLSDPRLASVTSVVRRLDARLRAVHSVTLVRDGRPEEARAALSGVTFGGLPAGTVAALLASRSLAWAPGDLGRRLLRRADKLRGRHS
jgi:glycosyltransferase involved in cell wall biosynthesis